MIYFVFYEKESFYKLFINSSFYILSEIFNNIDIPYIITIVFFFSSFILNTFFIFFCSLSILFEIIFDKSSNLVESNNSIFLVLY